MRHPCQAGDYHAERHSTGKTYTWRACIDRLIPKLPIKTALIRANIVSQRITLNVVFITVNLRKFVPIEIMHGHKTTNKHVSNINDYVNGLVVIFGYSLSPLSLSLSL